MDTDNNFKKLQSVSTLTGYISKAKLSLSTFRITTIQTSHTSVHQYNCFGAALNT